MLAIPVPFVIALALCLILGVSLVREGQRPIWPLTVLLLLAAVQSMLVGLRWMQDLPAIRFILPITASVLPPLAYAVVNRLSRRTRASLATILGIAVVLAVVILSLFWRAPIDVVLALSEVVYGIAILTSALTCGPGPLWRVAILGLGGLLVVFAVTDAMIGADFAWHGGRNAPAIVSGAGLVTLAGLACLVVLMGRRAPSLAGGGDQTAGRSGIPAAPPSPGVQAPPTQEDAAVLDKVAQLMGEAELYRDADLTLDRLARRAAVPARAISAAMNRTHGQNVSQFVNGFRVAEAQRLLGTSDRSVTAIMFDAGFQTKSNFNREFRRVAGCSPTEWRHKSRVG